MNEVNVENYLTLTQKYSILLLATNDNEPLKGKIWFQKELFLVAENIQRLGDATEFEEDLMGPYSPNADAELEKLQVEGLVELSGKIRLTPEGEEVARRLEFRVSKETKEILSDMKSFINDLSEEEVLGFIYFSYPHMVTESIMLEEIKAKRCEIAVSLCRKKKVSIGKAALIAGLSQEDFINKAKANGVTVFSE
jgi:hypothetical protein